MERPLAIVSGLVVALAWASCGGSGQHPEVGPTEVVSEVTTKALEPLQEQGLYVISASGDELRLVTSEADIEGLGSPQLVYDWSPDGSQLAYVVKQESGDTPEIRVWDEETGDTEAISLKGLDQFGDFSWSPDGSKFAVKGYIDREDGSSSGAVAIVATDGKDLDVIFGPHDEYVGITGTPTWSPDGKHIVFSTDGEDDPILVLSTNGSVEYKLPPGREPKWSPRENVVAFLGEQGLYVTSVGDDKQARRLAGDASWHAWSPDGNAIVYSKLEETETDKYEWVVYSSGLDQDPPVRVGKGSMASWSPDSRSIAFMREGQLYIGSADGKREAQLTEGPFPFAAWPLWSPASDSIAFVYLPGEGTVYIANADGSGEQALVPGGGPKWSPDGRQIAFVGGRGGLGFVGSLYVMSTDGGDIRRLAHVFYSDAIPSCSGGASYEWAPDGQSLVYVTGEEIYTVALGGESEPVFLDEGLGPTWSSDGSRIAYSHSGGPPVYCDVLVKSVSDIESEPRTVVAGQNVAWAPTGDTLAFVVEEYVENKCTESEIRVWAPGEEPDVIDRVSCDRLPDAGFGVRRLYWSPDGTSIAYSAGGVVYVVGLAGGDPLKLGQGVSLDWSPDGKLVALDSGVRTIYAAASDGSSPPERITEGSQPDWSPGGGQLAFVRYREP